METCALPQRWHGHALIDDYGHHPVEMARHAGSRARCLPGPASGAGFPAAPLHPHARLLRRFCEGAGAGADAVLLAEVYAAGEAPIVAADGRVLARALRIGGKVEPLFVDDIADHAAAAIDNARDGDVLMCMGAGSIGAVPGAIVELLAKDQELLAQQGRRYEPKNLIAGRWLC